MKRNHFHILLKPALQLLLILLLSSIAHADFSLQAGSFQSKNNANICVKRFLDRNINAFIYTQESKNPGKSPWYKVRVGPFATRDEALNRLKILSSQGYDTHIIVVESLKENKKNETVKRLPSRSYKTSPNPNLEKTSPPTTRHIAQTTHQDSEKPVEPDQRDVPLKWGASKEPDLAGYKIYYDTDPGPPYDPDKADHVDEGPSPVTVGKDVTEITLHGLSGTRDYYFSITSFNTKGLESDYSPEILHPRMALQRKVFPGGLKSKDSTPAPVPARHKPPSKKASPSLPHAKPTPVPARPGTPSKKEPPSLIPVELPQISPGDVIDIEIPGQKEMSKAYDVDPSGYIYILMIGKILVKDLNVSGLDEYLSEKTEKFIIKGERASTRILERKRYIQIYGGVHYPGWYRVPDKTAVDDLIETAGGLLPGADYSRIRLKRETTNGYMEIGVKGKITLRPNDILVVPPPEEYSERVDSGDLLFITIPQRQAPGRVPSQTDITDLSVALGRNQVEVDRNGYLFIPDYGHFYVINKTHEEVKAEIIGRLPKYIAMLEKVEVGIVEKRHFIRVSGHVTNPGIYVIPEKDNAQIAINKAGNAIDGAVMSDVVIFREIKGRTKKIKINLYQYNITGDTRLLTPLHEEDEVFVPISSSFGNIKRVLMAWSPPTERLEKDVKRKVRIFGAIHNIGIYEHIEDMDLLDLMVLASGETEDADLSKILLIRNNVVVSQFNMFEFLKYEGTTKGSFKIPKIEPGDTVYVKYLEWKTAEPKEDKVWYITGEVKAPGQYKLWDQMTVLQAIARAGGLDEWADAAHITIVRTVSGKQENIPFNYYKGVAGKLHELNVTLMADDVVVVPEK